MPREILLRVARSIWRDVYSWGLTAILYLGSIVGGLVAFLKAPANVHVMVAFGAGAFPGVFLLAVRTATWQFVHLRRLTRLLRSGLDYAICDPQFSQLAAAVSVHPTAFASALYAQGLRGAAVYVSDNMPPDRPSTTSSSPPVPLDEADAAFVGAAHAAGIPMVKGRKSARTWLGFCLTVFALLAGTTAFLWRQTAGDWQLILLGWLLIGPIAAVVSFPVRTIRVLSRFTSRQVREAGPGHVRIADHSREEVYRSTHDLLIWWPSRFLLMLHGGGGSHSMRLTTAEGELAYSYWLGEVATPDAPC